MFLEDHPLKKEKKHQPGPTPPGATVGKPWQTHGVVKKKKQGTDVAPNSLRRFSRRPNLGFCRRNDDGSFHTYGLGGRDLIF